MDSWIVAKGILEAIAVLVGLFVAFAAVMWIGLGITCVLAMLDIARKRLWESVVALFRPSAKEIPVSPPISESTPQQLRVDLRMARRIFLRKHYADRINSEKRD